MASNSRAAKRREAREYIKVQRVERGDRDYGRARGSIGVVVKLLAAKR